MRILEAGELVCVNGGDEGDGGIFICVTLTSGYILGTGMCVADNGHVYSQLAFGARGVSVDAGYTSDLNGFLTDWSITSASGGVFTGGPAEGIIDSFGLGVLAPLFDMPTGLTAAGIHIGSNGVTVSYGTDITEMINNLPELRQCLNLAAPPGTLLTGNPGDNILKCLSDFGWGTSLAATQSFDSAGRAVTQVVLTDASPNLDDGTLGTTLLGISANATAYADGPAASTSVLEPIIVTATRDAYQDTLDYVQVTALRIDAGGNTVDAYGHRIDSAGYPIDENGVRLHDAGGNPIPPGTRIGQVGELYIPGAAYPTGSYVNGYNFVQDHNYMTFNDVGYYGNPSYPDWNGPSDWGGPSNDCNTFFPGAFAPSPESMMAIAHAVEEAFSNELFSLLMIPNPIMASNTPDPSAPTPDPEYDPEYYPPYDPCGGQIYTGGYTGGCP